MKTTTKEKWKKEIIDYLLRVGGFKNLTEAKKAAKLAKNSLYVGNVYLIYNTVNFAASGKGWVIGCKGRSLNLSTGKFY